MRIVLAFIVLTSLVYSGYGQLPGGMMDNPALMMSMLNSGGMGGGMAGMAPMMGGVPMMDLTSAPVMDPKMFANMAKFASLMGGPPSTNPKAKTMAVGKQKNAAKQQPQSESSSGLDPLTLMTLMNSGAQMDPMMLMLLSSQNNKPAAPADTTQSSGGLDPMTMMYLMQSGGGASMFG